MRGEHEYGENNKGFDTGSSPHARGALVVHLDRNRDPGIIPACAGSTLDNLFRGGAIGDHPRMRGEHRKGGA